MSDQSAARLEWLRDQIWTAALSLIAEADQLERGTDPVDLAVAKAKRSMANELMTYHAGPGPAPWSKHA